MAALYVTGANEALDLICLRHYGQNTGAVEQVLEANPAIAPVAHRLPMGQKLALPDLVSSAGPQMVRLWD